MELNRALRITKGEVLAFVGGGGKTTSMFRLASELASKKMRVLTTTSTRIFAAQIQRSPAHIMFDPEQQSPGDLLPLLDKAIADHSQVLLIGQGETADGKALGVPPEIIDAMADSGHFDVILNEADGSRMRPFKAPAAHEPVIPTRTTLVVPVVGMEVIGQPLDHDLVHRVELVHQLSQTAIGQPMTTETVATVLAHPQGGLRNVPPEARVIPLLNKVETPARLEIAREVASQLLRHEGIDSVVLGTVQSTQTPVAEVWGRTAAVILAAGGSSRFGSPKQLAPWQGKTFIEHVTETALASPARPVVVVLGAEIDQSRALLNDKMVQIVINPNWAEGQSTSMQAGLAALPPHINSAIFMLVDLPGVTTEIITRLIECHRQTLAPLVWPEFEGKRGNPVLFDRSLFPELAQIGGDTGGRPLVMKYQDQAERVAVSQRSVVEDFDRPEDLEKFQPES